MPTVAEHIIDYLASAGVKHIWGIAGDSVNAFTDCVRRHDGLKWMHVRHEEAAAFAASGEAQVTGRLAAVAASCGPGSLHLINGLYDAHRSRCPVLAIVTQIPLTEMGSGYFQETHDTRLFQECSHFCELLAAPDQLPRMIEMAVRAAILQKGVAVIVVPGDVSTQAAPAVRPYVPAYVGVTTPPAAAIDAIVEAIAKAERPTIMAGIGCEGAEQDVIALAARLQAPIAHAFRGKPLFEGPDNAFDMGLTGLVGESAAYRAIMECDLLLLLGCDFPYEHFLPGARVPVVQVDTHAPSLGRRTPVSIPVLADVGETVRAVLPRLTDGRSGEWLETCRKRRHAALETRRSYAGDGTHGGRIQPEYVASRIDALAAADAAFTVDTGANNIWAARYISAGGERAMIGSYRHGSMANATPQAMGIAAACPGRQVIALAGDGGFAMLMGELLTIKQLALPVKVVIFDNHSLGFVALEMKAAGYINYGVDLENPDFGAMARTVGIFGVRVEDLAHLDAALINALAHPGPAVIDVVTATADVPNFAVTDLEQVKGFSLYALRSVFAGRGQEVLETASDYLGKR